MTKRKNLTILSAAGITSALAMGAFGSSVGAATLPMEAAGSLEAPAMTVDMDGVLVSSESEESGAAYAVDEVYDEVRAGARLVIAFDPESNAFGGLVENTTEAVLDQVRVEVHLSNGTELGPTTPTDLAPGEVIEVVLPATAEPFDSFSAHPEIGPGDEEDGEHEGRSEGKDGDGDERGESEYDDEGDEYEGEDEHEDDEDEDGVSEYDD